MPSGNIHRSLRHSCQLVGETHSSSNGSSATLVCGRKTAVFSLQLIVSKRYSAGQAHEKNHTKTVISRSPYVPRTDVLAKQQAIINRILYLDQITVHTNDWLYRFMENEGSLNWRHPSFFPVDCLGLSKYSSCVWKWCCYVRGMTFMDQSQIRLLVALKNNYLSMYLYVAETITSLVLFKLRF